MLRVNNTRAAIWWTNRPSLAAILARTTSCRARLWRAAQREATAPRSITALYHSVLSIGRWSPGWQRDDELAPLPWSGAGGVDRSAVERDELRARWRGDAEPLLRGHVAFPVSTDDPNLEKS
jgi:hypothetical protein